MNMASRGRIIIYLLRNDLRVLDNEVLHWSNSNADLVLPLYCFDPRHFKGTWHFQFPKTAAPRTKFLLQSVADLRNTLKQRGSGLIVRHGQPEVIVPQLISQLGKENVSAVTFQEEVTKEELDVEAALRKNCGVNIKSFWGSTMYHKDDVPFKRGQVPDVYSEFRRKVESQARVRPLVDVPSQLKPLPQGLEEGALPTYSDLNTTEPAEDSRTAFPFKGGESNAIKRLTDYFWGTDNISTYKETRNGMMGSDYSTKFSPWLAHGCLSPRYIYHKVKEYESQKVSNQSTYWVIFEVIWRDYFKFVGLKYGDRIFYRSGIIGDKYVEWKKDMNLFNAWKDGRTGVPYVDANMREMAATGFMSNRGRQNVASFLTKNLGLDWRLGAEWFESLLIDHDVCSNYGNWLYSAGIGNDPRENRKFNQIKQAFDYDADGDYVRLWVPELQKLRGGDVHVPWTLGRNALDRAEVSLGETYPNPIIVAPEWSKHTHKKSGGGARGGGGGRGGSAGYRGGSAGGARQKGINFYFKAT